MRVQDYAGRPIRIKSDNTEVLLGLIRDLFVLFVQQMTIFQLTQSVARVSRR